MTKRVYLPKPLPHQMPVLGSTARIKVVCCGRRWGKTKAGLLACVEGHGPPGCHRGAIEGGTVWWVAPSYPIASMIWRDLKHCLKEAWSAKNEVERRIELDSGGSISVRSADNPDSLRGVGLDGLVIDEAAFCRQETWTEALRPALADRQGWAVFISTPCGQNWFHDLWERAPATDGMESWQRPTSDNPLIPKSELDAARLELGPYTFSQEFEAQFVAPEGALFKREDIEIIEGRVTRIASRVRGWDLAASLTGKRTAGVLLAKTPELHTYVVEDVVKGQWLPGDRDKIIRQTAEADGLGIPIRIEQEPGSGGVAQIHAIVSSLAGFDAKGVRVTGDKITRADPVAAQAGIGRLQVVRGDWVGDFLSELETFPSGQYLDQVDALSIAFDHLKSRAPGAAISGWRPRPAADDWRNEIEITDAAFTPGNWRDEFPE